MLPDIIQVVGAFLAIVVIIAPLGCWSVLNQLVKIEKEVRDELRILNSQIRNRHQPRQ